MDVDLSKTAGKPIRCKAAVAREAGEPLVIEEVIVGPPKPGEVRIKIICTSLCFSDISFWRLKRILGHEAVGFLHFVFLRVVESIGEDVHGLSEGDMRRLFTEYTVVDVANLTKIDPAIPPNRACLLSCGVSTGAAWRSADVEAGSTVAIFGLGAIGLAVGEGSRLCGATRIIGVDINPSKYEIGKTFGVTDFVDSTTLVDKSVIQVIKEMTDGCVGMASLVHEAFSCCLKGWGKTVLLGVDKPGSQLIFASTEVLHSGKTIQGSLYGGLKPKTDIPILVRRYLNEELELDKFVTHEVGFENINKAFDLLLEGKSLRCVIWMDK
ncbi:OLC1v1016866C1 [Oldenlandia corymbosa var. corymbosa]|uniref:OLC1v1016866C1 n=1 Tax=Oldenlandia corymbosa var. corymbosa TaxID=529605 RepID=A0AAV1E851_OLDCO|nr:OLC1v1016866C1 [Oldenlandia corymbosa var. corymbosa]